jgi:hypothetical protein
LQAITVLSKRVFCVIKSKIPDSVTRDTAKISISLRIA